MGAGPAQRAQRRTVDTHSTGNNQTVRERHPGCLSRTVWFVAPARVKPSRSKQAWGPDEAQLTAQSCVLKIILYDRKVK
jgi:hypothetical protein